MQWNKDRSVKLSKVCIIIFAVSMIAFVIFASRIFLFLEEENYMLFYGEPRRFSVIIYFLAVPAATALAGLWKLLANIEKNKVFVEYNVKILRILSWWCFLAAIICIVSSIWYFSFLIVGAAAGFVGILLRVVKNVFARAVDIKAENDYTI